jgi:hypothetical protein
VVNVRDNRDIPDFCRILNCLSHKKSALTYARK